RSPRRARPVAARPLPSPCRRDDATAFLFSSRKDSANFALERDSIRAEPVVESRDSTQREFGVRQFPPLWIFLFRLSVGKLKGCFFVKKKEIRSKAAETAVLQIARIPCCCWFQW